MAPTPLGTDHSARPTGPTSGAIKSGHDRARRSTGGYLQVVRPRQTDGPDTGARGPVDREERARSPLTPDSWAPLTDQLVPSSCNVRVLWPRAVSCEPTAHRSSATAHTSEGLRAATA